MKNFNLIGSLFFVVSIVAIVDYARRLIFQSGPDYTFMSFIVKIILTFVLLAVALYILLSGKYDDNEKALNWAYSFLALISGVWIGTTTTP